VSRNVDSGDTSRASIREPPGGMGTGLHFDRPHQQMNPAEAAELTENKAKFFLAKNLQGRPHGSKRT